MSSPQNSNILKLIVISYLNSYIIKKALPYFTRPLKSLQRKPTNILTYLLFIILLLTFNYFLFKLSSPTNLYDQIGAYRRMTADEIKNHIEQIQVDTIIKNENRIQNVLPYLEKLKQIKNILTHSARRLTYDTFGLKGTEYAWAFLSPNFLISMLISSAIFYIISLIMNIIGKDNKFVNMKGEIIIIIITFIWETQVLMHSEQRLHAGYDYVDYVFSAFPIFQRREMMKYFITPLSNLLQNFNSLFVYSKGEVRFGELVEWVPPGYFMQIQNYLKEMGVKGGENLEEEVQVALKGWEERVKSGKEKGGKKGDGEGEETKEEKLRKVQQFRAQRGLLSKFIKVQGGNIYQDLRVIREMNSYCLVKKA